MDNLDERFQQAQRWYERAQAALKNQEIEKAISYCERAVKLYPAEETKVFLSQLWFNRAYLAQLDKRFNEAITYYRLSIEIFPTAEAHTFLGWTYSFQGRLEDAIAECVQAIAVDPTFGNPYNDIGAYLIQLERWQEAIPWLEKAIYAPRYEARVYPYCTLGQVYEKLGQWQKAMDCYRSALSENPTYQPAEEKLLNMLARLN